MSAPIEKSCPDEDFGGTNFDTFAQRVDPVTSPLPLCVGVKLRIECIASARCRGGTLDRVNLQVCEFLFAAFLP